jgi:hypothetical protein
LYGLRAFSLLYQEQLPSNPRNAMEARDYKKLQWKIISISLSFSLIPLFALGLTIYYQFSVSTINSEIIDTIVRAAQIGKKGDAFLINHRNYR